MGRPKHATNGPKIKPVSFMTNVVTNAAGDAHHGRCNACLWVGPIRWSKALAEADGEAHRQAHK